MPTTKYIWDDDNLLAEADGANTIQTVYTNEPQQYGNLVSSRLPIAGTPTTFYHHFDAIGSTRQLTNAAGSVSDTVIYDAWGDIVNRTGATTIAMLLIAVSGYYFDVETAQTYVRGRPYDPIIGRWTTQDPFRFIDSVNSYIYVHNCPLLLIDPSGLLSCADDDDCCCCVKDMKYNFLNDLKPRDSLKACFNDPNARVGATSHGNEFLIQADIQKKLAKEDALCELEWWEKSSTDVKNGKGQVILKACERKNQADIAGAIPALVTFADDLLSVKCPGNGTGFARDCPITALKKKGDKRLLCIEVRLKSTCSDCEKKEAVIYVKQVCEFGDNGAKCTISSGEKAKCTDEEWKKYCDEKKKQ